MPRYLGFDCWCPQCHYYMDISGLHFLLFKYCLLRLWMLRHIHVISCCHCVPRFIDHDQCLLIGQLGLCRCGCHTSKLTRTVWDWPHKVWHHRSTIHLRPGKSESLAAIFLPCLQSSADHHGRCSGESAVYRCQREHTNIAAVRCCQFVIRCCVWCPTVPLSGTMRRHCPGLDTCGRRSIVISMYWTYSAV